MATERVLDPVCGMRIDPATAAATVRHGGVAYHFCSEGCARRFQASPSRFIGGGKADAGGLPMAGASVASPAGSRSMASPSKMPATSRPTNGMQADGGDAMGKVGLRA
ncbi:MAG: P-type Cu+ transporter, partial [Thermoplasmata archaeon]|nr:P-type Cu+ transporter [Thermoplasmata archaeon]